MPTQKGWQRARPSWGSGPLPGAPLPWPLHELAWLPPPTLPLWKPAAGGWILWGSALVPSLAGAATCGRAAAPLRAVEEGGLGVTRGGGSEMTTAPGTPALPTRAAAGTVTLPPTRVSCRRGRPERVPAGQDGHLRVLRRVSGPSPAVGSTPDAVEASGLHPCPHPGPPPCPIHATCGSVRK